MPVPAFPRCRREIIMLEDRRVVDQNGDRAVDLGGGGKRQLQLIGHRDVAGQEQRAVAGGLLGGLAGALTGGDNAGRNALIGAATGALVGGAAGYYSERQKQIADDKQRIASYGGDFERSTMDLDRSIVYAKAAQDCYQREFDNLRAAHRNKSMSDSEGRSRFAEIVSGLSAEHSETGG